MTSPLVCFTVEGVPRAKQSFVYTKRGGFTPARVKSWQSTVGWTAKLAYRGREPLTVPLAVQLSFRLPTKRRIDNDNLSKAVLDGCNGILWEDDKQVVDLHVRKELGCKVPGVDVCVYPYTEAPSATEVESTHSTLPEVHR